MKVTVEGDRVSVSDAGDVREYGIGTPEAFRILGKLWLRSGWDVKYVYSFTWLGRPIIQFPEDLLRLQEVVYRVKPDVIVETGVAHGGSLIFHASLCKAMGHGRVIGVDVEIRPQNRSAIEAHELASYVTLIEGDSIDPATVEEVKRLVSPGETAMLLLDSKHSKAHVMAELNAYGPLVTPGSYAVAMDGIMEEIVGAPRTHPDWAWDNPRQAALEFVAAHPEFEVDEPGFLFNESAIAERLTYWPSAFLRRVTG